jgi:chromosome segregation ATPase
MDYIKKITELEKKVQDNKVEVAKLEERKKNLSEEREKLLSELSKTEVKEADLEITIIDMEQELMKEIERLENELKM